MSIDEELRRVLKNPDNVIVSDSLNSLISSEEKDHSGGTSIDIGGDILMCQVMSVKMTEDLITFSLNIPTFSLKRLLMTDSKISLQVDDNKYTQAQGSDVVWEDGMLTITTRRILNETV